MSLTLDPNLADADGVYADLIEAHEGLTEEESHAFNARLILILANHVGDRETFRQALEAAGSAGKR
ncbi:hypothetical protein OCH239_05140 [Roseivivax halodurans JCM 10272]|uniref:DNA topoisomerase IV subunit B n=1 Tax=Roseivivax halodurans JCM 10272 TaxID=1449350 RepID=X7EDS9_9RHOB|nr:DUF2783 domain-containing protein [Roseivivax halodurans]ETX14025.1 hypothetical protein OCH239_05140 [Roseivivax halodurans JCM 10272]